jgi:hypothetical protein
MRKLWEIDKERGKSEKGKKKQRKEDAKRGRAELGSIRRTFMKVALKGKLAEGDENKNVKK